MELKFLLLPLKIVMSNEVMIGFFFLFLFWFVFVLKPS